MVSYETLIESIVNIQEYCHENPKYVDYLGAIKDLRIELEMQRIMQLHSDFTNRNMKSMQALVGSQRK